jgi:hypothetical protein
MADKCPETATCEPVLPKLSFDARFQTAQEPKFPYHFCSNYRKTFVIPIGPFSGFAETGLLLFIAFYLLNFQLFECTAYLFTFKSDPYENQNFTIPASDNFNTVQLPHRKAQNRLAGS